MLNVDLSIRHFDGQAVVALRGELSLADTPGVASHLIAAVAACGPSVIVDLTGLEGMSYSGLSVLLRIRKWTRRSGGDLPLAAPQQPVRRILEATGLIDVFSVYPSVEEAASSARRQAQAQAQAPQQLRAAMVTRPGGRRPVCRAARHSPVRPLPGRGVCRPGRIAREACVKWRSPGGTTATGCLRRSWPDWMTRRCSASSDCCRRPASGMEVGGHVASASLFRDAGRGTALRPRRRPGAHRAVGAEPAGAAARA